MLYPLRTACGAAEPLGLTSCPRREVFVTSPWCSKSAALIGSLRHTCGTSLTADTVRVVALQCLQRAATSYRGVRHLYCGEFVCITQLLERPLSLGDTPQTGPDFRNTPDPATDTPLVKIPMFLVPSSFFCSPHSGQGCRIKSIQKSSKSPLLLSLASFPVIAW